MKNLDGYIDWVLEQKEVQRKFGIEKKEKRDYLLSFLGFRLRGFWQKTLSEELEEEEDLKSTINFLEYLYKNGYFSFKTLERIKNLPQNEIFEVTEEIRRKVFSSGFPLFVKIVVWIICVFPCLLLFILITLDTFNPEGKYLEIFFDKPFDKFLKFIEDFIIQIGKIFH